MLSLSLIALAAMTAPGAVPPTPSVELSPIYIGTVFDGHSYLAGDVRMHGTAASFWIEYRRVGDPEFIRVAEHAIPAVDAHVEFGEQVSGLTCASTYEVRGVAEVGGLRTLGELTAFPTAPCAPHWTLIAALPHPYDATLQFGADTASADATIGIHHRAANASYTTQRNFRIAAAPASQVREYPLIELDCNTSYYVSAFVGTLGGSSQYPELPFTTAPCPSNPPSATLTAIGVPQIGLPVTLSANASGGSRGYTYAWDIDGDGVVDRRGTSSTLTFTYPGYFYGFATVLVTDSAGAQARAKTFLNLARPELLPSSSAPVELCGDGDDQPEPGERWRFAVRIYNRGQVTSDGAYAIAVGSDRVNALYTQNRPTTGKLFVETPILPIGNLSSGAESVPATVDVRISPDASCGTIYEVQASDLGDRGGEVSGREFFPPRLMSFVIPAAPDCQVSTRCDTPADVARAVAPREGLYYNPSRPGNGLSIDLIPTAGGEIVFSGLWYTGDEQHLPTWYALQAPVSGNVAVTPIYRFRRVLEAPGFLVHREVVGQATIAFRDSEHAVLTWKIGVNSGVEDLSYYIGGSTPASNRTGAWFNRLESGSGLMVHQYVQPGTGTPRVFAMHFIYDSAGEPRWTFLDDTVANAAAGTVAQTFTSVHCPGCAHLTDWNSSLQPAGTAKLSFTDASNGSYSTRIDLPSPLAGRWDRTDLPLVILTNPQ